MPGRNGTGPLGMGPMTGRGMGSCRTGRRPRMGLGSGYGRRLTPEVDKVTLEDEKAMLEARLKEIENRLSDNK